MIGILTCLLLLYKNNSQTQPNVTRKQEQLHLYERTPVTDYRPKIACLVITMMRNWQNKAQAVASTWLRRCDEKLMFYSLDSGPPIPHPDAVPLSVPEG